MISKFIRIMLDLKLSQIGLIIILNLLASPSFAKPAREIYVASEEDVAFVHPTFLTAKLVQNVQGVKFDLTTRSSENIFLDVVPDPAEPSKYRFIFSGGGWSEPINAVYPDRTASYAFTDTDNKFESTVTYSDNYRYAFLFLSKLKEKFPNQAIGSWSLITYPYKECLGKSFHAMDQGFFGTRADNFWADIGAFDGAFCITLHKGGYVPQRDKSPIWQNPELIVFSQRTNLFLSGRQLDDCIGQTSALAMEGGRLGSIVTLHLFNEVGSYSKVNFNRDIMDKDFTGSLNENFGNILLSTHSLGPAKNGAYMYRKMDSQICKKVDQNLETQFGKDWSKDLEQEFQFSFIQSISWVDGSLCFSQFLYCPQTFTLKCLGTPNEPSKLISDLSENLKGDRYSMLAMSVAKYMDKMHYHFVHLEWIDTKQGNLVGRMASRPIYTYCNMTDDLRNTATFKDATGCIRVKELFEPPIDIVHYELGETNCNIVLYNHVQQGYRPDQLITMQPNATTVVEWMRFPINAVLAHKGNVYFFLGGNAVIVSKPKVTSECVFLGFEDFSVASKEAQASELILDFATNHDLNYKQWKGHEWSPVYSSNNQFKGKMNGLALKARKIDPEFKLSSDANTSTTTTTVTKPTPDDEQQNEGKISNMFVIIVVVLAILLVSAGLLYYVFILPDKGNSRIRGGRRTKSRRSPATVPSTLPGPSAVSEVPSAGSAFTVRSSADASGTEDPMKKKKKKSGNKSTGFKAAKSKLKSHKSNASKTGFSSLSPKTVKSAKSIVSRQSKL